MLLWQPRQGAHVKRLRTQHLLRGRRRFSGLLGPEMLPDGRMLRPGLPKAMAFINGQQEASLLLAASHRARYTLHLTLAGQGQGQATCLLLS